MVFGADIFHSGRTEQSKPSIAAVCASMDPAATIYSGRHSVNQEPRNEVIENLEGKVVELLKAFQNRNTINVSLRKFYSIIKELVRDNLKEL